MKRSPRKLTKEKPVLAATRKRVDAIISQLTKDYPQPQTALHYQSPFQLAIATILSAQCTDQRVNMVTPGLFQQFPSPAAFANGELSAIEVAIKSTGFFRNKARSIQGFSRAILNEHHGQVPGTLDELIKLPGIGRKTANVILGDAFGIPGITVDTHVGRLSRRLGFSQHTDPVKVEFDLMKLWPKEEWTPMSHRLILHGRAICHARNPKCATCSIATLCPKFGVTFPSKRVSNPITRIPKSPPQVRTRAKPLRMIEGS